MGDNTPYQHPRHYTPSCGRSTASISTLSFSAILFQLLVFLTLHVRCHVSNLAPSFRQSQRASKTRVAFAEWQRRMA